MSSKDFHKSMGNYIDVKRNGPMTKSRRRTKEREPLMRILFSNLRRIRRKLRLIWRKTKAFFGADHEVDLNSLHQDVFVIERDESPGKVFWRQLKSLFQKFSLTETEKKAPVIMKNHIFETKERLRNKSRGVSKKRTVKEEQDVDVEKINDIIRNNAL